MKITKQQIMNWLGLALIVLAMVFANLPFQYATALTEGSLRLATIQEPPQKDDLVHPVAAGWPVKFYYHFDHGDETPLFTQWRLFSMLLNGGVCLAVLLCIVLWQRRAAKIRRNTETIKRRQISISDLIVATFIIAMPLAYWQWLKRYERYEFALVDQLQGNGSFQRNADLPRFLIPYLPKPFVRACLRVTDIDLNAPSDESMAAVMRLPHLRSLRIGGGQYDLRHLDALPNFTHLTVLQVSGRVLDPRTVQVISLTERLRMLDLSRTNVSAAAVEVIGELPRLRVLRLTGAGVRLAELTKPICPATLKALHLPRPQPGESDEFAISGYPVLQTLTCNSLDAGPNASILTMHVADLPRLRSLQLDLLQKYALHLERLPAIDNFEGIKSDWHLRISETESFPFVLWLDSLQMDDLPVLREFNFFGSEIKQLRIEKTPELVEIGVGAGRIFGDRSVAFDQELSPHTLTVLMEGFANSDGPTKLDLAAVPLGAADLQPLARNQRLTQLNLQRSGTKPSQWMSLNEMKHLEILNLAENSDDHTFIDPLVHQFPQLKTIVIAAQSLNSLTIRDHAEFSQLLLFYDKQQPARAAIDVPYLQAVQLVNLPQFSDTLRLYGWAEKIHLENVPAMQGLAFSMPLPEGFVLKGFRDLEWFAAGGSEIDDQIAEELLACGNIQHLTLAYTAVSKEKLRSILQANPIRTLDLTGGDVDDSVFADWPGIKDVREIVLDETQVTEVTIKKLATLKGLATLGINGIPVDGNVLMQLSRLPELSVLRIKGSQCDPEILAQLIKELPLTELDLSGLTFTSEHARAMLESGYDRTLVLGLRESKIESDAIMSLASRLRNLRFDIAGAELPASDQGSLLAARRLVNTEDSESMMMFLRSSANIEQTPTISPGGRPAEAIIDARSFAPNLLDTNVE